jgi:hypothetical protein
LEKSPSSQFVLKTPAERCDLVDAKLQTVRELSLHAKLQTVREVFRICGKIAAILYNMAQCGSLCNKNRTDLHRISQFIYRFAKITCILVSQHDK